MAQMKKPVPASMLKKINEKARNAKVKITGSASTPPRVSSSMIKSQPKTTTGKKPMPKILGPIKPIRVTTPKPKANKNMPGQVMQGNKPGMSPKTPTKTPVKKKVLVMPNKISPSKMTPAQKARYLKNPERYDG